MKSDKSHSSFRGRSVYERMIDVFFYSKPTADLNETIHKDFMGYGTAGHEFVENRKLLLEMAQTQTEQLRNMNIGIKRSPILERFLGDGTSCLIVEEFNMHNLTDGHRFSMRLSTILERIGEKWLVTHFHASTPDTNVADEEALPMEGLRRKNRELEAKIKERTRELEIEAALERVRTAAMAMKKPDDMVYVCRIISEQLQQLNVQKIRNVQTVIINEEKGVYLNYQYFTPYNKGTVEESDYRKHPTVQEMVMRMLGSADAFFSGNFTGEELNIFREYRKQEKQFPDPILDKASTLNFYFYSIGPGALGLSTYQPLDKDGLDEFKRFHKVFSLAYRRFLDIQKAEAQAREAQIEVALEKVRSKTMSMRTSQDVGDTVEVMFDELVRLGVETIRCGIGILFQSMQMEVWTAKSGAEEKATLIIGRMDLTIHPLLVEVYNSWINGDQCYSYELVGEDLKDYFRAINNSEDYPIQYDIESLPYRQFQNAFFFSEGALFAFTNQPMPEEASEIFKRFAGVFGQTYRRFLDLVRAEAQAREAIRQSSLDRVRGKIASMRTAHDLQDITPIIWHELKNLDVPFIRCGVFFVDHDQSNVYVYLTTPDVKPLGVLSLPVVAGELTANAVDHWRKGLVYTEHWNKDQFIKWTQSMLEQGQIQNKETYQGSENPPEVLDLYFVPFTQGMLYVGNTFPLTDDTIQLVKSLADAFSIAYARYEDFNKLEKVKESIETTLTELKSTQAQLIQSEKMASLGELTAGVAHEIQNPLNFVNNFSEVSMELVKEMNEELAKGTEVSVQLAKEISEDIERNLEKINHHGKRADAIVKGMLQHSRSSNGVKEPTDINALADEYLRLAYHGLRAKDKDFNATLKTDFDETIGKIEVVPQDIGRVFLNLITNAFYAVDEKKKKANPPPNGGIEIPYDQYKPTVKVSTEVVILPMGGPKGVKITVGDNGDGIRKNIIDKIFQPFFTTKPSGQGTGLGLSLAYDIVKAHGGELKVNAQENEGTEFTIVLPI